MENFIKGIYLGIAFFSLVGLFFFVFVFTFVKEGTAKAITKLGQFHKVVMSYKDHHLVENDVVQKKGEGIAFLGGLKFVGVRYVHKVYRYHFQWASWGQAEVDGKLMDKPIYKDVKDINYILVQDDIYFTLLETAETKEMLPLNIALLITARITNPYKALFRIQHWLETTINRIKPNLRRYIGTKTYSELTSEEASEKKKLLTDLFEQLKPIREELEREYGVKVIALEMPKIDPATELAKEFIEISMKKYVAERQVDEITTLADGEVQRVKKVYEEIKKHGPTGMQIRALESLDKAGKGDGNWIIPFGSIQQLLEGLTGKKGGKK